MTTIPSSPVQARRGTDERERLIADLETAAFRSHKMDDMGACNRAVVMLRADAEQLRAMEARLQTETEIADRACAEQTEIEEQLRARDEEIAALRKNAERYLYVRDAGKRDYDVLYEHRSNYLKMSLSLDEAIDAALQEKSRDAR